MMNERFESSTILLGGSGSFAEREETGLLRRVSQIDSGYFKGIHQRIASLAREARGFDFRGYERSNVAAVRAEMGDAVFDLVSRAVDLAGDLFFACEQGDETSPDSIRSRHDLVQNFELRMDRMVSSSINLDLTAHVADISFIARAELAGRLLVLQRTTPNVGARALVVNYESAVRRTLKSLMALDSVLAPLMKTRPLLDYVQELDRSLRVRAAYFEFLQALRDVGQVDEENVHQALRAAGTRMAMLVGKEVYGEMRMADRFRMADIQQQILNFMREPRDFQAGLRIWEDLKCSLEIFREISHREELRAHDLDKLVECRIALSSVDEPVDVVLGRSSALELLGLDADLDDAITGSHAASRGELIGLLRKIERRLEPHDGSNTADHFA